MEIDKPCKERRCVEMIYPAKHAELQQQLDVPIQERKKYGDQLSAMKQVTEDRSRLEKSLIESEESMYVRRIRSNVTPTAMDNQDLTGHHR